MLSLPKNTERGWNQIELKLDDWKKFHTWFRINEQKNIWFSLLSSVVYFFNFILHLIRWTICEPKNHSVKRSGRTSHQKYIQFDSKHSNHFPNTNIFSKQIDSEDFNCIDLLNGSQPFTMMAECEWERETKLERAHRYKWWQSHPISKTKMPIWSHKLWRKIFVLLGFSFSFVWLIIQQKNCVEATTSSSSRKRAALVVVVVGCAFRPDVIFSCVSDSRKLHCFENIEYLSIGCFS